MLFKFLPLSDNIKSPLFFSKTLTAFLFFSLVLFLFLPALAFSAPKFSAEQNANRKASILEELNFHKSLNSLEVDILFNRYTIHRNFELTNPNRIVIDFFNVRNIQAVRYTEVNDFGIKDIRAGKFKPFIARVVFDLEQRIPSYRIERIQGGLKIFFPKVSAIQTTLTTTTSTTTTTIATTTTTPTTIPTKITASELSIKKPSFLKEINLQKIQNSLEINILFNRYTIHRNFELTNPNRIVIDFFNVRNIQALRYTEVNDFGIKDIRAGRFKPFIVRVVFDLEKKIPIYKVERIQEGLKVSFITASVAPTTVIPTFTTATTVPTTTTTTTTTSTSTTTTSSTTTTTTTTSTTTTTTITQPTTTTTIVPTTTTTSTSTTTTSSTTTTTTTSTVPTTTTTTTTTAPTTTSTTTTVPTTTTSTSTTTTATTTTTTTTLLPSPPPPPTTTTTLPPPPTLKSTL